MIRILLLLLLCVAPAAAQTASHTTGGEVTVTLTTSEGPIVLALDRAHAPVTTANFLRYVDAKRFDGVTFYRAMNLAAGIGLIQGGLRNDPRKLYPPIAHESTTQTGLAHVAGTISMARDRPGTATADFFICIGSLPSLDAHDADLGFAAFGHVTSGMDVAARIMALPTSPTAGGAAMRGQMLEPPVRILAARRGG